MGRRAAGPAPLASSGGPRRHHTVTWAITATSAALAQREARRNRSAFATTETELKLMAAAAMIGLSRTPKNG